MRISPVENLRIPEQGSSTQGKSGPKARPKGVVDGQQVENPVPSLSATKYVVTQEDNMSAQLVRRTNTKVGLGGKPPKPQTLKYDVDRKQVEKHATPHCQENPLSSKNSPVPQTDTGRKGENPKTSGRTFVKELGKMTP
ncbi:hypothetical protein ING2D1G_0925 [Peptoniphilus sp. ING2-D1G]|nr:hypothetical protein ING2D1G_0113 [Peptoniphilus sp. ING2-D1G]CDZ74490.1 hypothetical protein ING2D1G_0299 [Peptoniphilus sp. ING2-D1G]CDZ74705.1 hypothetical protein ING2D1G_0527 [Peptoniphilus sp. ING2-D1G]CDZ75069.1 hypothetical protein ING2D1G_0925 [Peptoniphilus sp. ING2-D1G]